MPVTQPLLKTSSTLPAELESAFQRAAIEWEQQKKTERLWQRDASLWAQPEMSTALAWLDLVERQLSGLAKFKALAAEIREDGYHHLVLLGASGSTLIPEVFRRTSEKQEGFPELLVLDSSDPAEVRRIRKAIDPKCTLFCVSDPPGTAPDPRLDVQYFFAETRNLVGEDAGHHFIATTTAGSPLERTATALGFRRTYYAPSDIAGPYLALSDLGLVPHAAAGLDTEELLENASGIVEACHHPSAAKNPGVALGLLAAIAGSRFGRNKVTLVCSESISSFGAWWEYLLADSATSARRGLVPVNGEPLLLLEEDNQQAYAPDRLFFYIRFSGDDDADLRLRIKSIEKAGLPVVRTVIEDLSQFGQLIFQWQFAAAVAVSYLGLGEVERIEPVADPVSVAATLPSQKMLADGGDLKLFAAANYGKELLKGGSGIGSVLRQHMDRLKLGSYFGLIAYLPKFAEYDQQLQEIRKAVVSSLGVATVLRYSAAWPSGPRAWGVFVQITHDDVADLPIPGQSYTFGTAQAAQANHHFQQLADVNGRVVRVHLENDLKSALDYLRDVICAAIEH